MSQLTISSLTRGFKMNVLAFSSPTYAMINSAQTRTKEIHFPIKISQPALQFDVIFRSHEEYEDFQRFVRNHHKRALTDTSLLTLSWPERGITNWTGMIKSFKGGGERFSYAPRARIEMELVNSMVSSRTLLASLGSGWQSVVAGLGVDSLLRLPDLAEAMLVQGQWGQNLFANGQSTGDTVPTNETPIAPAPPGAGGIVTGS